MQKSLDKIDFLIGDKRTIEQMPTVPAKKPFDDDICAFLNVISKELMKNPLSRQFADVVTLGFWIRKASIAKMRERLIEDGNADSIRLGRGVALHIAPSNVPVNFAYSLVAGLLTGNANIVRVPSKHFPQVDIIADAMRTALEERSDIVPYICLVRYDRDKEINDALSAITDTRIIWGGDNTIAEIRKSSLPPRSAEITFADRYSLAVIDADAYMAMDDKDRVAEDFYNDTYLSDQNACTSPRVVIWTGNNKSEAKEVFWSNLHRLVDKKYNYQDIQGVNKLTSCYLAAVNVDGMKILPHEDNLIVRISVPELTARLMDYKDNSGYFYEYDCANVDELYEICNDKRCQTIGMIGGRERIRPLIERGVKGIDRVVPIGHTMDFDVIWDGYELMSHMTRVVTLSSRAQ